MTDSTIGLTTTSSYRGDRGGSFSLDLDPTKAAVGGFDGRIDIDVSLVRWWKSCVRTFLLTGTVEPVLQ